MSDTDQNDDDSREDESSRKSESESDSDSEIKMNEEFNNTVKKFVKLDNEIREYMKKFKALKDQRKICETYIIKALGEQGVKTIEINGGRLKLNKKDTKTKLKEQQIKTILHDVIKDADKIEDIVRAMNALKQVKTNVGLYRIFKEKSKNYIFLFIWILLVFVLFSISKSKLVWYIIPIYPALALLTGHFIDDAINIVLSKIKVGRVILKFLLYFLLIDFGLFYLFLVRGLAYPADLTGSQANLLQRKEKEFGYVEKLYADRIELPLTLYYQNGPFEIVDFGPLKRKLANAGYKGRLIFITKESRFNGFLKVYPRLSLVEQDKEWVLAILPSVYELDTKALSGVQGEIAGIEDKIKTDAKDGKVTKAKIVERLFYLRDENLRISKKIDIGLKSDL